MLYAYPNEKVLNPQEINANNQELLREALWIDMFSPTKEEETMVERHINFNIPTREEMQEIELSNRLYTDDSTIFMTATMVAKSDSTNPKLDPVTFVLTPRQLITIRYIEPQCFKLVIARIHNLYVNKHNANVIFIELLTAAISRLADILELVGKNLNECSVIVFRQKSDIAETKLDYRKFMQKLGGSGDLNSKACDSLISFERLIDFFKQAAIDEKFNSAIPAQLDVLNKDIISLIDHTNFLSNKINFLLGATLGLVNIEQNNTIKIFSVAAVIFLPPTLIASVYGMNFKFMPELTWQGGYYIALSVMLLSAWLPYKYFKYRKWL